MPVKFNPFSASLQLDEVGSGGGGSSVITGAVETFADLPETLGDPPIDAVYLVREASGAFNPFATRRFAGLYIRSANTGTRANDWTFLGAYPDLFLDGNFLLANTATPSKQAAFDLSAIASSTTRTITVPNTNVTLPDQGTSTGDTPTFAQVTINDTVNEQSTLTLSDTQNSNKIEFATAELTLRHTGAADTPYINVTDGTDYALLGVRQGDMFLQSSNAVVRIEQGGGNLADIKMRSAILEDFLGANEDGPYTATFDAQDNLSDDRVYTLPDASGTIALTSQISKTYAFFTATDNQPPATAFSTLDSRNGIALLDFDDITTESAVFVGVMPEAAALSSGLIVRLIFTTTILSFGSGGAGSVRWSVAFERGNTNLNTDSFDTAVAATVPVNTFSGVSGSAATAAITITTIDGITAGDLYRLRVQRRGADSEDTASGDAELIAVEIRSAA